MQVLQRLAVGPLQVVEDEKRRPISSEQCVGDGVPQAESLLSVRHRFSWRICRISVAELGKDAAQFGALLRRQLLHDGPDGRRAQPAGERSVDEFALGRVGPRFRRDRTVPGAPGAQVFGQGGLADARLAGEQREARAAVQRSPPTIGQNPAFRGSSDQAGGLWSLGAGLVRTAAAQALILGRRLRRRLDAQFARERRDATVIDAQGASPIPRCVVEPHQQPVRPLVQRIGLQQPLSKRECLLHLLVRLVDGDQPTQRLSVPIGIFPAGGQHPVVVAPRDQVPAVDVDRSLQRSRLALLVVSGCQRGVEPVDVQLARRSRPPLDGACGDVQVAITVRQGAAQRVQQMAKIGPGLALRRVRPELEGQLLSRLRGIAVQQQVGEQRLGAARVKRDRLRVPLERDRAKESDTQHHSRQSGSPAAGWSTARASLRPERAFALVGLRGSVGRRELLDHAGGDDLVVE